VGLTNSPGLRRVALPPQRGPQSTELPPPLIICWASLVYQRQIGPLFESFFLFGDEENALHHLTVL
jgi:hypothetical protein